MDDYNLQTTKSKNTRAVLVQGSCTIIPSKKKKQLMRAEGQLGKYGVPLPLQRCMSLPAVFGGVWIKTKALQRERQLQMETPHT